VFEGTDNVRRHHPADSEEDDEYQVEEDRIVTLQLPIHWVLPRADFVTFFTK
jgi:hypothetical protein